MSAVRADDPRSVDWASLDLPEAEVDRFDLRLPWHLLRVLGRVLARERQPIELPADLPGRDVIPGYARQEFHNLPGGNFSRRFTHGYLTGFERVMLGSMGPGRTRLAERLAGCRAVLDLGCAGGKTAAALKAAGVPEVWGLDPSPYMLQHAAAAVPDVPLVQAAAEDSGFADGRFDGIAVCFVLHELPPRFAALALTECRRILRPGGLLALCEPAPIQLERSVTWMARHHGWRGLWFAGLARWVHEPFVRHWHAYATRQAFEQLGFDVLEDEQRLPHRHVLLRKPAG